jgi:hypothetical protein
VVGEIMRGGYAFSGVYADPSVYSKLKLYVLFGGLDLPLERVAELARDTQGEYEVLQEKLAQVSNPKSQIPNLPFLEGGLRLERGEHGEEDNVFAQMARKRKR